jgi:lipopolysaccharide transport system ATP-binding protein
MSDIAITVENLSKSYWVGHRSAQRESYTALRDVIVREARNFARKTVDLVSGRQIVQGDEVEQFWALRDVSFEVKRGEVLGIIGRNGAGKSTLLKILSRITEPDRGRLTLRGRVASLLEVGTGFHPELTGRENIFLNGAILGMSRKEIKSKFDEIVDFAEIEDFLDTPVKRYSSGMYVRLAFSVAAHLEPEILIVDEVLAVGDAQFQAKCLGKMSQVANQFGRTVLFVSHNMSSMQQLCTTALLLERGTKRQEATPREVIASYLSTTNSLAEVDLSKAIRQGPQDIARLKRLWLLDGSGNAATTYIMNQPFVARIELECSHPASNVEIGIRISSRFGPAIHLLTSTWEGLRVDLTPGLHKFEVRMPHVMLFPGTYMVGAWVLRVPDWNDDGVPEATSIAVIEGDVNGRRPRLARYAFSGSEVYSPCQWRKVS